MTVSLTEFYSRLTESPTLAVTVLLTLGVIFVNGWTDAPNAIAACVSTRCIGVRAAIRMAAVFNFLGVLVMSTVSRTVADTVMRMVDLGGDRENARIALCAALTAIVLWAVAAWRFGIPTSESHALIAGLSGAAIALQNGFGGIHTQEWVKVLYGLGLSTVLGFVLGFVLSRLTVRLFRHSHRATSERFFGRAQVAGGAAMAFMHGAQDGQKFMGVFMLGIWLSDPSAHPVDAFALPLWLMVLCSLVMAVGTSVGGLRIIKAVGMDMVRMERYQGFAADAAGAVCLLLSTLAGLPVSTTHTKATAIMGVGAAKRLSAVRWNMARDMVLTWILTFPGCGVIGYLTAKLFMLTF